MKQLTERYRCIRVRARAVKGTGWYSRCVIMPRGTNFRTSTKIARYSYGAAYIIAVVANRRARSLCILSLFSLTRCSHFTLLYFHIIIIFFIPQIFSYRYFSYMYNTNLYNHEYILYILAICTLFV